MPYYAEFYVLSDAITKNSILVFGMCDLVEKLHVQTISDRLKNKFWTFEVSDQIRERS